MRAALLLLGLGASACGGGKPSALDGVPDAPITVDSGASHRDTRHDAGPRDAFHDGVADLRYGEGIGDIGGVDGPLSPGTALYIVTASSNEFSLRTVATDGTGAPTLVPGFGGLVDFDPLTLASLHEAIPVRRDLPQAGPDGPFRGLQLPGKGGTLYYFHRRLVGSSGLLVVAPTGQLRIVHEVPSLYADALAEHVALSADGTHGAAVEDSRRLVLFRTDGAPVSGSSSSLTLAPPSPVVRLTARSLSFAGNWVYVVGQTDRGTAALLRVARTGTSPLVELPLPAGARSGPPWIAEQIATHPRGSHLLVAAGAGASSADLYAVAAATGVPTKITSSPGILAPRGEVFGAEGAQLALSPNASFAAYVKTVQGKPELFVAATDGKGPAVQLSDGSRFRDVVISFVNLWFADDTSLFFMAGTAPGRLDLYRADLPDGRVTNLTAYGSAKAPFDGNGRFAPRGAFTSPSGNHLYWIELDGTTGTQDLRGLRTTGGAPFHVTRGALVTREGAGYAHCPSGDALYFVVQPSPSRYQEEVFGLHLEQGGAATKLTTMAHPSGAPWIVRSLTLSSDCGTLVFSAGGHPDLRYLWRLPTAGSAGARPSTAIPRYITDTLRLTPDGQTIVHGSGGAIERNTLKAVHLAGGTPVTLDPQGGVVHVLVVY